MTYPWSKTVVTEIRFVPDEPHSVGYHTRVSLGDPGFSRER